MISYILFLFPITNEKSVANTIWFAFLLGVFYCFYTLTMLTYYATFSEVADSQQDRVFLANTKSVCDVIYFSLGFALIPVAALLAILLMLVYIAIRFSIKSGVAAIVALAHDVFVVIGSYVLFGIPVNMTFIAVILTILGYSINATIIRY